MYLSDFVHDAELGAMVEDDLPEPQNQACTVDDRYNEAELTLDDFSVEDSWVLDDFDDLLPGQY
jgi:hypothetical protein